MYIVTDIARNYWVGKLNPTHIDPHRAANCREKIKQLPS